ncbi:unnamed protein product [Zymoseptoria tritici ST99CH_1A5]|nr:unnamed protein product [Zymoseptoria tritici ST99CH_1E4]SMY27225.1 unnamed protein product [Zymoseptoria tritici ST99CH_1A5]
MNHNGDRTHYAPHPPPSRQAVELPRPLEPRANHHLPSPLIEASGSQRRPDSFQGPGPVQPEYRPQSQNLPRLQDILTSASPAPSQPPYQNGWSGAQHSQPPRVEPYYSHHRQPSFHAPLPSPHHPSQAYAPHTQSKRMELPIIETSPVVRHDSRVPTPPYATYSEARADYNHGHRERPRQGSSGSYPHNGVPSPYAPGGAEEAHYRSPGSTLERPRSDQYGPLGAESSKKYVGVREVPGEGTFHLYEGGFRIPTHVDGETVNPAWGLTKANKPRKRLAMACLDCREKKIKCEPGAVSCLQCEKAKRTCRKAPTHQSQPENNSAPVWQTSADSPSRKSMSDSSPRAYTTDVALKRRLADDFPPPGMPSKKPRSISPVYGSNGAVQQPPGPPTQAYHHHHSAASSAAPRSPSRVLSWEEDPYFVDRDATIHLLNLYFANVNDATYCIFPRRHFMHWLETYPSKSQNERMVLYAMLAVGSVFAGDQYSGFARRCVEIAAEAVQAKIGRFSMPVVQTRLLLGLYHYAKGAEGMVRDYIGSGINTALFLRYHTEQGCVEDDGSERSGTEFAFTPEQTVECKRRTFWSGFLMDRYCGLTSSLINPQDVFLRLPCFEENYERGMRSDAPHFNNESIDPTKAVTKASSSISPMGWVVLVAAIWGDVVNFIYRAVHRSPVAYEEEYEKFYSNTCAALQSWRTRLPDQLQFSQANVEASIKGGYAGPYISMHVLYHLSWVKMNRFVRHSLIPRSLSRNVRATHSHSHDLLQVVNTLRATKWEMAGKDPHAASFTFTTPFAGYAILAAIDVVGAGGLDSHLRSSLDLIGCGLESLRELSKYWSSARQQNKDCEIRYYQIQNVLKHPFTARSGCWLGREWGVDSSSALEKEFAAENDCIYGVDDRVFFDALADEHGQQTRSPPTNGAVRANGAQG